MVKCYRGKKDHGNHLIKKKSLRVILRIMFSYYKPMKYMDIICITTSIIYTFNNRGKTFKPTSSSFKIIRNHEHYLQYGIHHSKCYLQKYLKLVLLFQTIQLIAQRPITRIYEETQTIH